VIARRLEARWFAASRTRLGERSWREAHAAGAALTARQAVDAALGAALVTSPVNAAHEVGERGRLA
jgi:hypothetical protein